MASIEDYFFSSCDTERIENVFLGAVLSNDIMELTSEEKERARENIGAGKEDRNITILGYYNVPGELPEFPEVGDVYAVGYSEPYNIYIWDGVHNCWVDNGPLETATDLIDDTSDDAMHAFSSSKIYQILDELTIDTAHLANDSVVTSKIVDNAVSIVDTAVIHKRTDSNDISPWVADTTSNAAPYTQEIVVASILADDSPIIDVSPSSVDYTSVANQINAWSEIYRIETLPNGGGLKVYAHYPTQVDITIKIMCVRK